MKKNDHDSNQSQRLVVTTDVARKKEKINVENQCCCRTLWYMWSDAERKINVAVCALFRAIPAIALSRGCGSSSKQDTGETLALDDVQETGAVLPWDFRKRASKDVPLGEVR